jgi:ubiquinone biosynthesis protein COQ4
MSVQIILCPMNPIHFRDPRRPALRLRPFRAFGHFRRLVADKEDTAQVFHMSECLPSRRMMRDAAAFCASDAGQALMTKEPYPPDILDDHDALLKLPEGSVAHAYVAFMRREGLSAGGLVAESEIVYGKRPKYDDQLQWFGSRLRDTHDMVHILTDYGRDALGEQCALGFSSSQYPGLTDWFLAWAGALELKRRVKTDAPVFAAVGEARRCGRAAQKIYAQNFRTLLAEPLEAARARMNIGAPTQYRAAHNTYRARGIDPYNFLAAAA